MGGINLRLALCLVLAPFVSTAWADEVPETSLIQVPQLSQAPVIDGVVDKREWYGATLLPGLIDSKKGLLAEARANAYIGYDGKAIYIAFQIPRSEQSLVPAANGDFAADDTVEIRLDPAGDGKNILSVQANAAAASSPRVKYQGRPTPQGWEGEMVIPFTALRHAAPAAGETWGFDFINHQRTPSVETSGYSFGDKLSRIRFVNDAPGVRFVETGAFQSPLTTELGGGVELEMTNFKAQPSPFTVSLELLKRKPEAVGGYLPNLAAGLTNGADIILATQQELIKEELAKYTPVATENLTVNLPAGERWSKRITAPEIGNYLVKYRLENGGKVLSAGVLPFVLEPPMRMTLNPYYLSPQLVEAQLDFSNVKEWEAGARIKASIVKKEGDAPLAETEAPFSGAHEFALSLPIDKLEAGNYSFRVSLSAPDGKPAGSITEGFQRPPTPAWFTKKAGLEPVVPDPWKAIEVNEKGPSFLMGDYVMGTLALPTQIHAQSIYEEKRSPLLTGPMALTGKIDGKDIQWSGGTPQAGEKNAGIVHYTASATCDGLKADVQTSFEYDGMARVSLKLSPEAGQKPLLNQLCLEVPISAEFAELFQNTGTPLQDRKKIWPAGASPKEGMAMDFTYSIWIGNEERGFRWFAENKKGWHLGAKEADAAVELAPGKDGTVLKIHLVNDGTPPALDKEREIVFGYMFTPARSINYKPLHYAVVYSGMEKKETGGVNAGESDLFPMQGWPVVPEGKLQEMQDTVKSAHEAGVVAVTYGGWFLARESDLYHLYGKEMTTSPPVNAGAGADICCWNTAFQDAFVALWAARALDVKLDGYRFDAGFSVEDCYNLHHEGYGSVCGYYDDDGKLQPSRAIFAARAAAQRLYREYHGGVKKGGLSIQHIHFGNRYDPILSHEEAVLSVEGAEMKMNALREFPLPFFRAGVMGDAHGWQVIYLPKAQRMGYDARFGLGVIHNMTPRGSSNAGYEEISYSRSATSPSEIWAARDWIAPFEKGTELWGYWKNAKYLDTGSPSLVGTFQAQRGKKILLSVLNLDTKAFASKFKLDLKALGFKDKVYAFDPVLHEEVKLDGDTFTLPFTAEGYRLVEFSPTPFELYTPQIVGPNLIPELDPAAWPPTGFPAGWQAVFAEIGQNWTHEPPKPENLRAEKGEIILAGNGVNNVDLRKYVPMTKDKPYMLEADVAVESDDGIYLGPNPDRNRFVMGLGVVTASNADLRSFGAQSAPGKTDKVRLYFIPKNDHTYVDFSLAASKGKVRLKNLGLYELASAPPWSRRER